MNSTTKKWRRRTIWQSLESRVLLAADLVAHWTADDLNEVLADQAEVAAWNDSVSNITAEANGQPRLSKQAAGGRSTIVFDPSDDADWLDVPSVDVPITGATDFAVAVTFVTDSQSLIGDETGKWFDNTGLVDSNSLNFGVDWGLGLTSTGRVSFGIGNGFGAPPSIVYSDAQGLNDGQLHTVVATRVADELAVYVDDHAPTRVDGGTTAPLDSLDVGIGALRAGGNPLAGQIADVRMYQGALDSNQAQEVIGELTAYYNDQPPLVEDDAYTLNEDPSFFFVDAARGLLANDRDPEGLPLTASLDSPAAHGTVAVEPDGSFVYNPDEDFFGTDSFTYTASDFRPSEPATVTLTVTPERDGPHPVADQYSGLPTQPLVVFSLIGVLANDANPDRAELSAVLSTDVAHGSLDFGADGAFTYEPQGFSGTVTFGYQVDDGSGQLSPEATVTLVLNTAPIGNHDQYEVEEDTTATIDAAQGVLANDLDADQDVLTASLVTEPTQGTLSLSEDGSFQYTANENYVGADSFQYRMTDGVDNSDVMTVTLNVTPVNDAPVAEDDHYLVLVDQPLDVSADRGVLRNDSDVEGEPLTASLSQEPRHGTVTVEENGSFVYQPDAGYSGTDQFIYSVSDGADASSSTVHLRIDDQPIVISELMAANGGTIETRVRETPDGRFVRDSEETFDWIELTNPFDSPLAIGGLYLTDDLDEPTMWQIPPGEVIPPSGQWTVFASGLDIHDPLRDELGWLHTNFKLSADGGTLAITSGEITLMEIDFPGQQPDVSYGIDGDQLHYFANPTPGQANGDGLVGIVGDTQFSVDRGFYTEPQTVEITSDTELAVIWYTTDGSAPDPSNPSATRYAEPITIATTTTLRAAAFRDGYLPTNVDTQTYIFVEDVIRQGNSPLGYPTEWIDGNDSFPADYEMDPEITQDPAYQDLMDDALLALPTISLVTDVQHLFDTETGIYQHSRQDGVQWERPASVEYIQPDGSPGFQVNAGLRIQGGASRDARKSPKHSFRLLFKDAYGASKLEFPLFGPDAASEFDTIILRAGFNQSYIHHNTFLGDNRGRAQYVRDQWAKNMQLAMGHPAAHNNYAHLYVNGMYWGLYNPTERPTDGFGETYLGGDKTEYDAINSNVVVDGTNDAWREMQSRSREDMTDPANYAAVAEMLDIKGFIDYMVLHHYGGNMDWDSHNWYALRRNVEGEKWRFFSWDSEFIFRALDDNQIGVRQSVPGQVFHRLTDNAEFRMMLADAIQEHLFNDGLLTPDNVIRLWNSLSEQIETAMIAESARWGDYRRDVHQWGGPFELLERDNQWLAERNRLLNEYFPQRTDVVIQQYRDRGLFPSIDAPVFSQRGGTVSQDSPITLDAAEGAAIYYTLDGSDPRLPGGNVSAAAVRYQQPFTLDRTVVVRARARSSDGQWSALDEARFLVDLDPASVDTLRISEIHYHPADPSAAEMEAGHRDADDFEFIELINIGDRPIDLTNVQLTQDVDGDETIGVAFDFAEAAITQLAPRQALVVVEDTEAFVMRYTDDLPIAGQWSGGLGNGGEQITLRVGDAVIHQFAYDDAWHPSTDGEGFSLVHRDIVTTDLSAWNSAAGWQPSAILGGTPGRSDAALPLPGDVNGDGRFDSSDLVKLFQVGEFEDGIPRNSTFFEGDFNGDGDFDSADLVFAFQHNSFVNGAVRLTEEAVDSVFAEEPHARRLMIRTGDQSQREFPVYV